MSNYGILVEKSRAEKAHAFLLKHGLLEHSLKPGRSETGVIFPVKKIPETLFKQLKELVGAKKANHSFEVRSLKPGNLKEALKGKLSKKEMSNLITAYDTLGEVAIIEVPRELKGKEKLIGNALLETRNSIKSVYVKTGAHQGVFREEPVKHVAGKKAAYAMYREHGCTFRVSLGKVFFSPRLSTERKRVASKIRKGEHVAALFAGVGPFPIVFAKNSPMEKAVAIELNPVAVEDMEENIKLNKVEGKVEAVLGDVKKLSEKYEGKFDRAVMPLPKGGEDFLSDAIGYIKAGGGVVHYYQFVPRKNPFAIPLKQIKEACTVSGRKYRVLVKKKVRDFAPDIIQVVIDFRVWR